MGSAQESISIRCMVFVLLASQYIFIGEERHESRGEKKLKGDGRTDRRAGRRGGGVMEPVARGKQRRKVSSWSAGRRTGWLHARGGRMKREGNGKRQLGVRESDEWMT